MNNMYDILNKMKLLEGKGSKPDFLDIDKDGDKKEPMKKAAKEVDEASYSAKAARAGKDIGKPGKAFAKIAKSAGEHYGSKERGEKVAGAVLAKLRAKESVEEGAFEEAVEMVSDGNDFTGARLAAIRAGKPTFKVDGKTYKVTGDTSDEKKMVEYEFDDRDDFDRRAKPGDTVKGTKGTIVKTAKGLRHEKKHEDEPEARDDDDTPKKKGRPKGTGRKLGAKGPTGKSKLLNKGAMKEGDEEMVSLIDKGEYDQEGEMAKQDLKSLAMAAKELHGILGDDENLPEWVQSKITKALDYINSSNQYMHQEKDSEPVAEKAVSKKQQKFMGMVHAAQKGEKPASKEVAKVAKEMPKKAAKDFAATKHKGLPEKKKEESVEETTVAGSVATAPATGKKSGGKFSFGQGVYEGKLAESFDSKLTSVLNEGMSININVDENGTKSMTVNATDDDAMKLAQILKLAGMEQAHGYDEACPACGSTDCGCEGLAEGEYANSPEVETADTDTMVNTLSGGLNGKKTTGQTTIPVVASQTDRLSSQVQEQTESRLWDLYKKY